MMTQSGNRRRSSILVPDYHSQNEDEDNEWTYNSDELPTTINSQKKLEDEKEEQPKILWSDLSQRQRWDRSEKKNSVGAFFINILHYLPKLFIADFLL